MSTTATAPRVRTYGLLAAGMIMFGSATPVSKIVTGVFPVGLASGARMALAAALLLGILAATGRLGELRAIPRAQWPRIAGIAVFGMVGFSVFLLYGMKEISGAAGGIVMATTPAITAVGAVLFVPWAAVQAAGFDWAQAGATDWVALAWYGAGTMALGSLLWYRAVNEASGTTASAFMGVMPVSALLLSYVLLGEAFEWMHAVGMVAVLAGIAAVTRSHART